MPRETFFSIDAIYADTSNFVHRVQVMFPENVELFGYSMEKGENAIGLGFWIF